MDKQNNTKIYPKCLLVDDLSENLIALTALIKDEKVQVFTAQSGNQALDLMLENDFALAFVDVQMPDMDGFELAEIMRSTEKTRSIPIIFVTAAGSNIQRIFRGYEAGAVDFLHKPLASQVVISKVRIFLELYNQKCELEEKIKTLRQTEHVLQKALLSRDEFMSICSHELKTPLTSLKMQLQIVDRVREKQGDAVAFNTDRMDKFLVQADRSVDRIVHLVNDMLDISRVATGRLSLNLDTVDLTELTKEVIERLGPLMEMANCPVNVLTSGQKMVKADKFRIEQVLTNLLTNAAKYAPDHPVDVTIVYREKSAEVNVQDHGKGISATDQERVFERFERAVNHQSVSGLGLGLYISKEIIEMHHGKISVESKLNEGCKFTFTIPLSHD